MKNKFKNILCSFILCLAMLVVSNFSLASAIVANVKDFSFAEYKPTDFVTPYEFTANSGWSRQYTSNAIENIRDKFDGSSVNQDLTKLDIADELKPSTKYDGKPTTIPEGGSSDSKIDNYAMTIRANEAPIITTVNKVDENGKQVYEKNEDGTYKFVQDENGQDKLFDTNNGNTDLFVFDETTKKYKQKIAVTEDVNVTYSYKTNTSLSLKSNSFYVVTAWIWTSKNASASLVVSGKNFEAQIKNINTNGEWKQYYLFIESASDSSTSVNLSFHYGNSEGLIEDTSSATKESTTTGAIYLDNLCVKAISQTDFNNKQIGEEDVKFVDNIQTESMRYNFNIDTTNGNFETSPLDIYDNKYGQPGYDKVLADQSFQYYIQKYFEDGTEKLSQKELDNLARAYNKLTSSIVLEGDEFKVSQPSETEGEEDVEVPVNTFNKNNHVLKLENTSEKYSLGLVTTPITIKQFGYYRLSIFVKGKTDKDSVTVKLLSSILTGASDSEGALQVKSQTITAHSTSSDITNNWTEISFYIQGNCYYDTTLQVALLADAESTIYFDNMRLESITSGTYSNTASAKKFDLSPSSSIMSGNITNGFFNFIKTESIKPEDNVPPYVPANFTELDGNSKDVVSGVVSTSDTFYNEELKLKLGNAANPINVDENGIALPRTNILAMYAPTDQTNADKKHTFGYKSADFSLTSNSVYKLTFSAFANASSELANFKGTMSVRLIYSDGTIAEFEQDLTNNSKNGTWQKYTIFVKTGSSSRTCKLEIGVKDANGTIFFQNIGYTKFEDKTVDDEKITVNDQYAELLDEYNSLSVRNEKNVKFVDFDSNPTLMYSSNKVEDKDYYKSLSHSLRESESESNPIIQGELGIVDTNASVTLDSTLNYVLDSAFIKNPLSKTDTAMLIYNKESFNTIVNPNTTITLSSSSYYEISVYVKTDGIKAGSGLKIYMDKISVTFDNINTEHGNYGDLTESNGYKKFTALVRTGSSSINGLKISYELGSENNKLAGTALISEINVKKLDNQEAYNEIRDNISANDTTSVVKDFYLNTGSSVNEDADNLTLATFFLVFSSILLVGALVFAVVSIYIRKLPNKKSITGKNNLSETKNKGTEATGKDGFV